MHALVYDAFPAEAPVCVRCGKVRPGCRRHAWREAMTLTGIEPRFSCGRCGKIRDEMTVRRGRLNRRRGGDNERRLERVYGWAKVGEYGGPEDHRGRLVKAQAKAHVGLPPKRMAAIFAALDAINDGRVALIVDTYYPGRGILAEDYITIRGYSWLELFGRDEP